MATYRYIGIDGPPFYINNVTDSSNLADVTAKPLLLRGDMDSVGVSTQSAVALVMQRFRDYVVSNPSHFGAAGHLYLFSLRSGEASGIEATNVTLTGIDPGSTLVVRLDMSVLSGHTAEIANGLEMLGQYVREAPNHGGSPWGSQG